MRIPCAKILWRRFKRIHKKLDILVKMAKLETKMGAPWQGKKLKLERGGH